MNSPGAGVMRFRCPCCGSRTLNHPGAMDLCPVCWWEDDGQEGDVNSTEASEVRWTANGNLSLAMARLNFQECGAASPRFIHWVRKAAPEEQ